MKLLMVLLVLLLVPLAHAQPSSVAVIFDIQADNSVKQTTSFYFDTPLTDSSVNYTLSDTVKNVEVSDGTRTLAYSLGRSPEGPNIEIFLARPTTSIEIKYTAEDVVFQGDTVRQLFTEFNFDNHVNMTVQAKLPEGFVIYQNSFKPSGANIGSDGSRIILGWSLQNTRGDLFFVKYINPNEGINWIFLLAIVFAAAIMLMHHRFRKRTREAFMKGFREDEKKTIEFLEESETALQSDLQKKFGFSRAKATRIVSTLEEKGLLNKKRYGRTNKLYWIKNHFMKKKDGYDFQKRKNEISREEKKK